MKKIFVIPENGLQVRNPDNQGQPLPAEGALVTDSPYWRRAIKDGAVKLGKVPTASRKASSTKE